MSVFIISDLHLSMHLPKPMDIFSPRWHDHEKKIKYAWDAMVKENDTVIVGGDISWAMTENEAKPDFEFLASLPGKKILLKGNHDYYWSSLSKMKELAKNVGGNIEFIQNNAFAVEDMVICGTRGWYTDKEYAPDNTDYKKLMAREAARMQLSLDEAKKICGEREIVAITHFPPCIDNFIFKELIELFKEYGVKRCYYGHIHSRYSMEKTHRYDGIDFTITSADYLNFVPLKISSK